MGHCSAAALSQTVKTFHHWGVRLGELGPALAEEAIGADAAFGYATPEGWLPAEKALNHPLLIQFSTASAMMARP